MDARRSKKVITTEKKPRNDVRPIWRAATWRKISKLANEFV